MSAITHYRSAKDELSAKYLRASDEPLTAFAAGGPPTNPTPLDNVIAVGIGEQVTGGVPTGVLAVKLFVRIKYPRHQLGAHDALPSELNGLPVDIEEIGTVHALAPNPRTRIRPAPPGSSIGFGPPPTMAGTFGALAAIGAKRYVLSNNHVLANENQYPIGGPIYQPGPLDGGGTPAANKIAKLTKFIRLNPAGPNDVDCAIAEATALNLVTNAILQIGPPKGVMPAAIDMTVHKFGRTSFYTVGRIASTNTDVQVGYSIGTLVFRSQIIVVGAAGGSFSAAGDSGSLVLERTSNKAVGLLFAGSASHTICNHIELVLQKLGVTLA
ncbi:MAG TPA: hypothetical protein VEZ11_06900 [Thermoanaerobaculia bacterium]|nr:hypothetical protein [Thermoanaerobaculia bacterium]